MELGGVFCLFFFFFQAEDGIRDKLVTGVQTCALPISLSSRSGSSGPSSTSRRQEAIAARGSEADMTNATGPRIRALFLEDDRADIELSRALLTNAGLTVDVVAVDSGEAFTAALEEGAFDLILSDYLLPNYDGLSALKLARERTPETPFIIVSGFLGEERAIDTLKSGATDYVLKQRLDRLVPAVERALKEVRERKAREEAQRERERLIERERHLAQRLRGMTEASLAIASALSLDDVLQLITDQAREVVGAHIAMTTLPVDGDWSHAISSTSLSDRYANWRGREITPDGA